LGQAVEEDKEQKEVKEVAKSKSERTGQAEGPLKMAEGT
jgi:hypothetical protein